MSPLYRWRSPRRAVHNGFTQPHRQRHAPTLRQRDCFTLRAPVATKPLFHEFPVSRTRPGDTNTKIGKTPQMRIRRVVYAVGVIGSHPISSAINGCKFVNVVANRFRVLGQYRIQRVIQRLSINNRRMLITLDHLRVGRARHEQNCNDGKRMGKHARHYLTHRVPIAIGESAIGESPWS